MFWTCYLPHGDPGRCNFFAWDDEQAGSGGNGANPATNASGSGPSGNCYKVCTMKSRSVYDLGLMGCKQCDRHGHWANGEYIWMRFGSTD